MATALSAPTPAPAPPRELQVSRARVYWARMRKGISQRDLARTARVTLAFIKSIEQDKSGNKNPTIRRLSRIAAALDVTILDLLEPTA